VTATQVRRTRALQAAALCLDYPDENWRAQLPLLGRAAESLPGVAGESLTRFVGHAERMPAADLERDYVDTFDLRRRCCLYLTYYAFGDTRKRGMALLKFTHAYRTAGFTLDSQELPDHLAVVCEFAARRAEPGLRLLQENRAGIELLHLALTDADSPYADVVDVVRAVLPEAAPKDLAKALELARSGPPAEEVGLEPFAPPEHIGARR
jgi:nitrate reductase molybdenum cofactor assembly chaperone NarJ/NarW